MACKIFCLQPKTVIVVVDIYSPSNASHLSLMKSCRNNQTSVIQSRLISFDSFTLLITLYEATASLLSKHIVIYSIYLGILFFVRNPVSLGGTTTIFLQISAEPKEQSLR